MKQARVKHTRFNLLVWRRLPNCKEMTKVITASMDAKLTWREWLLMKIHLLSCDPCVNFLKQLGLIRSVLQEGGEKLAQSPGNARLSDDARARMKQALESSNPL